MLHEVMSSVSYSAGKRSQIIYSYYVGVKFSNKIKLIKSCSYTVMSAHKNGRAL